MARAGSTARNGTARDRAGQEEARVGARAPSLRLRASAARRTVGAYRSGWSLLTGPVTESAATTWRPNPSTGDATQVTPRSDSSRSKATPSRAARASCLRRTVPALTENSGPRDQPGGQDRVEGAGGRQGEDRLADGGAVRGQPAADPGTRRHAAVAGDLVDVQHLGAVEHSQVHRLVRGLEQILHERERRLAQVPLPGHELAELEGPHAEPVDAMLAFQHAQLEQLAGQPVHRGLRDPGTAGHLGQGQGPVGRAVGAENPEGPLQHRTSRAVSLCGMHGRMLTRHGAKGPSGVSLSRMGLPALAGDQVRCHDRVIVQLPNIEAGQWHKLR